MTDKGYLTSRHRRYLKYLNKAHDNKNNDEVNNGDEVNSDKIPDTVVEQCKRRVSDLTGTLIICFLVAAHLDFGN